MEAVAHATNVSPGADILKWLVRTAVPCWPQPAERFGNDGHASSKSDQRNKQHCCVRVAGKNGKLSWQTRIRPSGIRASADSDIAVTGSRRGRCSPQPRTASHIPAAATRAVRRTLPDSEVPNHAACGCLLY